MRRLLAVLFTLLFSFPAWALVNINTADVSELESLPGIGPSKAAAIVQYRTDNGPFKTVDQLDDVSGIGPSTLASLRDLVTVGGTDGAKAGGGTAPSGSGAASGGTASGGTSAGSSAAVMSTTTSSAPGCPVNINAADASGLEALPGIGASKAAAILQHRTDNGPFKSCDALDDVAGIGPATVAGLRDCCTVK